MREVDEISDEDLEAVSAVLKSMLSPDNPYQRAVDIAQREFGINIKGHSLLDRVMSLYATTLLTIDQCVINSLQSAGFSRLIN